MLRWILTLFVFAAMVTGFTPSVKGASVPEELVTQYLQLVIQGKLDQATALWSATYLASCARLDITYGETICLFDLASPLHTHLEDIRAGRYGIDTGDPMASLDGFVVPVNLVGGPPTPTFHYRVVREAGSWKLAGNIWATGRQWTRHESEFSTVFCQDESLFSRAACDQLDQFVFAAAGKLGVSATRLAQLRRQKILYYLCDDEMVAELTGYTTKGMADLAGAAVISSHFPHFHEVSHLLVNYALAEAPLYPLPLLQEGIACRLGGRWGRSPEVVLYMGWVNAALEMGTLGEILTRDGFLLAPGGADVSYAFGAVLCDLIIDRIGWSGLLALQESLAGSLDETSALTADIIAAEIAETCGWTAEPGVANLEAAFARWLPQFRRASVVPGVVSGFPPSAELDHSGSPQVTVRRGDGGTVFTVSGGQWPVVLIPVAAVDSSDSTVSGPSPLFEEVLPGHVYGGQPFGIRCSAESISIYDFVGNRMVGIWVAGFSDEAGAADGEGGAVVFSVSAEVLSGVLAPGSGWEVVGR